MPQSAVLADRPSTQTAHYIWRCGRGRREVRIRRYVGRRFAAMVAVWQTATCLTVVVAWAEWGPLRYVGRGRRDSPAYRTGLSLELVSVDKAGGVSPNVKAFDLCIHIVPGEVGILVRVVLRDVRARPDM